MFHRTVDLPLLLRDTPVVLVDAESADPTVSWVVPDEFAGAHAAVSELLAYGHRRIGFVTNKESIPATSRGLLLPAAEGPVGPDHGLLDPDHHPGAGDVRDQGDGGMN